MSEGFNLDSLYKLFIKLLSLIKSFPYSSAPTLAPTPFPVNSLPTVAKARIVMKRNKIMATIKRFVY